VRLKLDLDQEITKQLIKHAARERRPVDWQAEVLLRTALGLEFPYPGADANKQDESAMVEGRR
jgi:hypothetical protein